MLSTFNYLRFRAFARIRLRTVWRNGHAFAELAVDRFEPSLFPENQTASLTTAVRRSVAPSIQVNSLMDAPTANRKNRVARLMSPFVDPEALTTKSEHLGHERHSFELPLRIECRKDFVFASNLYPVPNL
jgi:hypothetical protein